MEFHQSSIYTARGIIFNYHDNNNIIIGRIIINQLISTIIKKFYHYLKTIFKIIIDPKITSNV